jgi:hypothetical protein
VKYLFISTLLLLLVGCSTTSVNQQATDTPTKFGESSIIVCRQNGGHLALRGVDLYINGKEVTTLRTGNVREVIVPAGTHRVTFKFPWDAAIRDLEIKVDVLQGATRNVVIGTNLDSFFILPKVGGFTTTWKAATVPEMRGECVSSNRPIERL